MTDRPRDLVGFLDYYLVTKAPFQIPPAGRELLVTVAPWVALIVLILSLGPALFYLGVRPGWRWWVGEPYFNVGLRVIGLGYLAYCALMFLALPGLFKRRTSGWTLVFYAELLSVIFSVALLGNLIGGLIGALIAFYVLFQIRPLYK